MVAARQHLAEHRKTMGYSQESLAVQLGADRSTVARWERGQCDPQPFYRAKLCRLLKVSPDELSTLLIGETEHRSDSTAPDVCTGDLEDMHRRELLRVLSVAGAFTALPPAGSAGASANRADEPGGPGGITAHLWQVFACSRPKRLVYPLVSQQLAILTSGLERPCTPQTHDQLCAQAGNLFQLAGEILFDSNRYTDAAHCYVLAAYASKQARAYDLQACALTRHAYIEISERRHDQAVSILEAASRTARRGDSQLPTRHWVAAVQAEAYAGRRDLSACQRSLDMAAQVQTLNSQPPGGWLRFDGSRLDEDRGTCYRQLGRDDLAETALTGALSGTASPRRRGSILTDLAIIGLQRRDIDQALQYGGQAATLAEQAGSPGYLGRKLQMLQTQLSSYGADNRLSQLNDRITSL